MVLRLDPVFRSRGIVGDAVWDDAVWRGRVPRGLLLYAVFSATLSLLAGGEQQDSSLFPHSAFPDYDCRVAAPLELTFHHETAELDFAAWICRIETGDERRFANSDGGANSPQQDQDLAKKDAFLRHATSVGLREVGVIGRGTAENLPEIADAEERCPMGVLFAHTIIYVSCMDQAMLRARGAGDRDGHDDEDDLGHSHFYAGCRYARVELTRVLLWSVEKFGVTPLLFSAWPFWFVLGGSPGVRAASAGASSSRTSSSAGDLGDEKNADINCHRRSEDGAAERELVLYFDALREAFSRNATGSDSSRRGFQRDWFTRVSPHVFTPLTVAGVRTAVTRIDQLHFNKQEGEATAQLPQLRPKKSPLSSRGVVAAVDEGFLANMVDQCRLGVLTVLLLKLMVCLKSVDSCADPLLEAVENHLKVVLVLSPDLSLREGAEGAGEEGAETGGGRSTHFGLDALIASEFPVISLIDVLAERVRRGRFAVDGFAKTDFEVGGLVRREARGVAGGGRGGGGREERVRWSEEDEEDGGVVGAGENALLTGMDDEDAPLLTGILNSGTEGTRAATQYEEFEAEESVESRLALLEDKTAFYTSLWGAAYSALLRTTCGGLEAGIMGKNDHQGVLLIFAHDAQSFEACRTACPISVLCIRGQSRGSFSKLSLAYWFLLSNATPPPRQSVYFDLDTAFLRPVLAHLRPISSLTLGGSLADDGVNTGVVVVPVGALPHSGKQEEQFLLVQALLAVVLLYLYDNPFAVDQRVLSAVLGRAEAEVVPEAEQVGSGGPAHSERGEQDGTESGRERIPLYRPENIPFRYWWRRAKMRVLRYLVERVLLTTDEAFGNGVLEAVTRFFEGGADSNEEDVVVNRNGDHGISTAGEMRRPDDADASPTPIFESVMRVMDGQGNIDGAPVSKFFFSQGLFSSSADSWNAGGIYGNDKSDLMKKILLPWRTLDPSRFWAHGLFWGPIEKLFVFHAELAGWKADAGARGKANASSAKNMPVVENDSSSARRTVSRSLFPAGGVDQASFIRSLAWAPADGELKRRVVSSELSVREENGLLVRYGVGFPGARARLVAARREGEEALRRLVVRGGSFIAKAKCEVDFWTDENPNLGDFLTL